VERQSDTPRPPGGALLEAERLGDHRWSPSAIIAVYVVTGALWVLLSDQLLTTLTDNPTLLARLETFKGWFYVLATAGLLYLLIRHADAELERRVRARTDELSTLLTVSHTVASTLELEPLLKVILEQLQRVVDYNGASILMEEGEALLVRAHHGPFSEREALTMRAHVRQPLIREVMLAKRAAAIADTRDDTPSARAFRAWAREQVKATPDLSYDRILDNIRSWVGVPLTVKGTVSGLLTLSTSEPHHYAERDIALIRAFADQVAVAIENARLHGQAERLAVVEERERLARELHD